MKSTHMWSAAAAVAVAAPLGVTVSAPHSAAAPAAASPPVVITRIQYDPPGPDDRSAASLNGEYLQLTNRRAARVNLYRWWVKDAAGRRYTFAGTFYLAPVRTVTIRTGRGTHTSTTRFWGSGAYVWNNTGSESARLYDPRNRLVDACAYRGTRTGYTRC